MDEQFKDKKMVKLMEMSENIYSMIGVDRINRRPSGRKGSRRDANTATTRELKKAARADQLTKRVEACGIE